MANLQEEAVWEDGVYQFEQTDVVQGGPEGIDNVPTGQLANRTAYLKQEQDNLKKKFDDEQTPNPLPQYFLQTELLRALVGTPVFNNLVGYIPNADLVVPSVGQKCYVSEYTTAYQLISASINFIEEDTKAASPFEHAAKWGFGTDSTGDFFTTPNKPLYMHDKAAGVFGDAGDTKEDHLQNITGDLKIRGFNTEGSLVSGGSGALRYRNDSSSGNTAAQSNIGNQYSFYIDTSFVVRTDTFTDTMGAFFDAFIWLPKGVF
ncbi:hypothetical protein [Vibrio algicola]|uniref:Tail fiber protein n=1 Tax=Vibrio algicola TaxID=2662262 RepID=A0A5Q0TJN9_9VIBR|nr:hypothetical protein [Vibrio algicola]